MTGALPPSDELVAEYRHRCGCLVCLVELRLDELAAAVAQAPLSFGGRARVAEALLTAVDAVMEPRR